MEKYFLWKVLISFGVAGVWIGGATLIAERLGSRKGGLLSNLPSTVLIALVFVALVKDAGFAARAAEAVPMGMLIDTLFLLVFILTLKSGLIRSVIISLGTWFILAFLARQIRLSNITINIALYVLVTVASFLILEFGFDIPPQKNRGKKFTPAAILLRAAFAGSVVAGTILISGFAGTYWVGLLSTFPAVMLSTMVILTVNQGPDFARATGKIMILSSTNIIVYALGVHIAYPALGIPAGTVLAFLGAFLWVLLLFPLIARISR
jgi:hypothetical protein